MTATLATTQTRTRKMKDIKYWIADFMFSKELDESYEMGIREGQRATGWAITNQLQRLHDNANKTNQPGIKAALDNLKGLFE
jgi:hypothetical protein